MAKSPKSAKYWGPQPQRSGAGGPLGMSKHRKMGTPGHNADLIQTARMLNRQASESASLRKRQRGETYESVKDLFRSQSRKKLK